MSDVRYERVSGRHQISIGHLVMGIAFLVMFALIAEAGPARMTLITYVNPAVALLLGALVLHEPITLGLVVGFPLVIVGSILGTWGRAAPPPDASVCDAETGEVVLGEESPHR